MGGAAAERFPGAHGPPRTPRVDTLPWAWWSRSRGPSVWDCALQNPRVLSPRRPSGFGLIPTYVALFSVNRASETSKLPTYPS
eukprot:6141361-Prymnesium_polylepis.1